MFNSINKVKNNSNGGFSLIEVLVAVAIISIVSIPLVNSFIMSAQVNSKSELKLAASTVAENAMESAKAVDIEDLTVEDDGKYYINEDAVIINGKKFNVQTVIDADAYEGTNSRIWNTEILSNENAAKFTEPTNWEQSMIDAIQNQFGFSDTILNRIFNDPVYHYHYEIIVNIDETPVSEGVINQQVKVTYRYYYKNSAEEDTYTFDYYVLIFDATGENRILENIVLNYSNDDKLDNIKIINDDNLPINVILMEVGSTVQDTVMVYESTGDQVEPFTGIWKKYKSGINYQYYESNNLPDDLTDATLIPNYDKSFDDITGLENEDFMYSIQVNVYEYTNTIDETIKYSDDIKVTSLDGNKLVK